MENKFGIGMDEDDVDGGNERRWTEGRTDTYADNAHVYITFTTSTDTKFVQSNPVKNQEKNFVIIIFKVQVQIEKRENHLIAREKLYEEWVYSWKKVKGRFEPWFGYK